MDLEQIKQILDLVREHDLSEFEIEHDGLRLKVRKDANGSHVVTLPAPPAPLVLPPSTTSPSSTAPAPAAPVVAAPTMAAAPADAADAEIELAVVKSPIVGTFYRSSEPGSASFVDIGSTIKKGDVLCIIEAMKLMNEIDSEYDGEVANIYVENGQPVQYGERLFAIRTR
jgi:acetyl-CoA carboxylase biotin carboxyl carrier protein